MPEGYLHLTCEQRCQIYALLQSGHSQAHIARQIGVDPSTISRELVRNTGARGYRFKQAHEKASQRRQEASDKPRKMTPDLVELIEEKLTQEQWSPDQISGRLAKDGVAFISHERIYQHVWKDKKDGGTLYLHLRHSGKKYNRRKGKNSGRGLIPNRVDIDQRPPIVAAKSRIGDWEADTIIGANHKGVVMSHVEQTSKYAKLAKLPDKNADSVVQACARVLLPLADQIETITYDNGKEFASHAQIATSLGALSYFAKPYHSWQRGLNEHTLPIRLSPTATSGSVRPCSWTFTSVAIFGSHNRSQSSSDFFPTTRPAPPTWRRLAGATGLFAPIVRRRENRSASQIVLASCAAASAAVTPD